jgi:F0F1-type ATP synthase gamma subunit
MIQYIVYGAVLQNKAWELSARIFSTKHLAGGSQSFVKGLTLRYNKAHQWTITEQMSEIANEKVY